MISALRNPTAVELGPGYAQRDQHCRRRSEGERRQSIWPSTAFSFYSVKSKIVYTLLRILSLLVGDSLAIYEKADNLLDSRKWLFRQYVSPMGRKVIEDWRKDMSDASFRSDFDTFLRRLAKMESWPGGFIDSIKGKPNKRLTELRWTSGKIEHRIVGYQVEDTNGRHQYLMLIGCTHKGRVYTPANALTSAVDRRTRLIAGEATSSEYQLIADR